MEIKSGILCRGGGEVFRYVWTRTPARTVTKIFVFKKCDNSLCRLLPRVLKRPAAQLDRITIRPRKFQQGAEVETVIGQERWRI